MTTHKLLLRSALLVTLVATGACTPGREPTPTRFLSPIPPTTFVSPPASVEVATPEPGKGSVRGRLSLANFPLPLGDAELYLGDIFNSGDGSLSTYFFDRTVNPKARWVSAETGEFVFENVDPGEYVLILWWDIASWVPVYQTGTTEGIRIFVVGDEVTELGLIESDQ